MNFKLWTVASVALSLAAFAGCVVAPSTGGGSLSGGLSGGDSSNNPDPTGGQVQDPSGGGDTSNNNPTGGTPDPGSMARDYYVKNVHGVLSTGANSCAACHATGVNAAPVFMDMDAEKSYDAMAGFEGIIAIPESSILMLHGKHTGPALSTDQQNQVKTWLDMEAKERGLGGGTGDPGMSSGSGMTPPPVLTLDTALKNFASCMDINDWTGNNLQNLANTNTNNNYGQCNSCHSTGEYGNFLSAKDDLATFKMQKEFPYIKRWVSGVYDMDGNITGLKAVPREYQKAVEAKACIDANPTAVCHPRYLNNIQGLMAGIDAFISSTLTKSSNGTKPCP